MEDLILGLGKQKSLRKVAQLCEGQVSKTKGHPRKIVATAETVGLEAERSGFEGEFERFSLRLQVDATQAEAIRKIAEAHPKACEHSQEDAWHILVVPPIGTDNPEEAREIVDAVSEAIVLPEVWRVYGDNFRLKPISIELLFQALVEYKASDVHLAPGEAPMFRVDGQARHSELTDPLSANQIAALIREMASESDWREFEEDKQTSFSFHQVGLGYSRASAFLKSGAPHLTLRFLPEKIPSFEDLQIPANTMEQLAQLHRGLLLVTGMTGSGKTTTCAALVDWINSHKSLHILTIENPIEYVHRNKKSIISQRTLGVDVESFNMAVTGALRHDPDVIVIGEMRDPDTIRSAINAAATGHLVISTLHANTASEVVNRVVSFFDPVERDLVRLQLRDCVQCIMCQRLAPKQGGGRIPLLEIMLNDIKPIRDAIIAGDTDGIRIGMQQTVSHSFIFEDYIHRLYKEGRISQTVAREYCTESSVFEQMCMGTYSIPRLDQIKAARESGRR